MSDMENKISDLIDRGLYSQRQARGKMNDVVWYEVGDLHYRLEFRVSHQLKYSHLGKAWPKHTQCLMFKNGLLVHSKMIVKHAKDEDNPRLAFRKVAEDCIAQVNNRWMRAQIRAELLKELDKI